MRHFYLSSMIILAILFLFPVQQTFAQGEVHNLKENKTEEPTVMDSMYSAKEGEMDSPLGSDNGFDNIFSPTDLFSENELVSPDPMPMDDMKMEGGHGEHARHQEPQIELSHHERVSSSSKGFGTAIGITLFAGLAFAGLTFMRPGE